MTTFPPSRPEGTPNDPPVTTPKILLVASWIFVGIPMTWGVYQTILKSLALFR